MTRKLDDWIRAYIRYTQGTEAPRIMHFFAAVTVIGGALRRKVWIDHILYLRNRPEPWTDYAKVHTVMPDGAKMWEKYPFASDHFPITVEIKTEVV